MIILRIYINRIPDNWDPSIIWYLAGIETLIEAVVVSYLLALLRANNA